MNKSLLKALTAAAVVGTTISLSSVLASAAVTTWVYNDATNGIADATAFGIGDIDMAANSTSAAKNEVTGPDTRTAAFTEAIFADGTKAVKGKKGININKDTDKYITVTPTEDGQLDIFFCRTDGGSTGNFRIYEGKGTNGDQLLNKDGFGRDDTAIDAVSISVTKGTTYTLYGNNGNSGLFALRLISGSDLVYYPEAAAETSESSSWIGGTPVSYFNAGSTANGGTLVGGEVTEGKRVRFGKSALADGDDVTSANMGYITFPGLDGDFKVIISSGSSGSAARPYAIGTFDGRTFTKIADLETAASSNAAEQVYTVKGGSANTTYAIYLEPKTDGTVADNTDFYSVSTITASAINAVTPTVTLSNPTNTDGKIVITGKFNDFNAYSVNKITLNAASAKTSADAAVWKAFAVKTVKKNDDGSYGFTVKLKDTGKDAKYQATAEYVSTEEAAATTTATAVSNLVSYTAAE